MGRGLFDRLFQSKSIEQRQEEYLANFLAKAQQLAKRNIDISQVVQDRNVSCQTQANTTTPSASPTKTHMNGMVTRLINPSEKSKDSPLNMVNQTPNEGHRSERDLDMSEQSQSGHHLFISESGEQLNPKQYGLTVVTIAVDTTIGMVKGIIDNGETKIQKAISAKAEGVHLHFIALHAAIYYLYAAKFLTIPETEIQKGILREISEGILIGFNETISNNGGDSLKKDNSGKLLKLAFGLYTISLNNELNELDGKDDGNFLNMGQTAVLFIENLAKLCGFQELLQVSPMDKQLLETIAALYGIRHLLELPSMHYFTFRY